MQQECQACEGTGQWETECCSGANGCDCRGQRVAMGCCNVCGGHGYVDTEDPGHDPMANCKAIAGRCFVGSGPTSGYWAGK